MQILSALGKKRATVALAAGAILASASAANAQNITGPLTVSGSAAVVSDYRYRGISLSDKDPAIQAGIHLDTAPGFFIGTWGSSIADFNGATTEIDVYGGWSGPLGPLEATVGITGYLYPGGESTDMYEFFGSLGAGIGPASVAIGLSWAPDQGNLSRSNRYLYSTASVGIPTTPITLKATLGHERGSLVPDPSGRTTEKFDWLIGADLSIMGLTLGVAYVGNDLPDPEQFNTLAKDAVVVSLSASF